MNNKLNWMFSFVSSVVVSVSSLSGYSADEHSTHVEKDKLKGDPYTLSTCPVSGKKLGSMGDPIKVMYEDRQILLCCAGCQTKFEKEPQDYIEKIDKEMIEDQLSYYPLDTCIISKQKLTAMGEPINRIYNNRLVRLCCNGCVAKFEEDPDTFINTINAAVIEKQKDSSSLKMCPVSNKENGTMGEGINLVIANRLVKLCCPSCEKPVLENPQKYLSKLDSFKELYSDSKMN